MNKLFSNAAVYALGRVLPQVVNFLLLPIYTTFLTPSEYGIIESMLVIGAVLSIFFSFATERSLFRVYYDYTTEDEKKKFIGNTAFLIFFSANIFLLLMFLLKDVVSKTYSAIPFYPYFVYTGITAYILAYSFIPLTLYQVQEKASSFFRLSILSFLFELVLNLFFVLWQKQGAEGFLKGKLIAAILMFPIYIYIIKKSSIFKFDKRIVHNILSFSLPMLPILLISWVMNMSNRIFIENYFSLKEVGLFSMAFRISSIVTILLGAIFTAYNPLFYRLANEDNKTEIKKLNNLLVIIIFVVGLLVCLFTKEIFLLLNKEYRESENYIPLLILSVILNYLTSVYALMIYQNKRSGTMMWINFFVTTISVFFNFLLVPRYGSYGATWATVIVSVIMLIITFLFAKRNYYVSVHRVILLLSFTFFVIMVFVNSFFQFSLLYLLTKIILILVVSYFLYKRYYTNFKVK